jgi:REase_DpnII-MboI/Uncharacterized protein conserved in bacteria (DUF2321)
VSNRRHSHDSESRSKASNSLVRVLTARRHLDALIDRAVAVQLATSPAGLAGPRATAILLAHQQMYGSGDDEKPSGYDAQQVCLNGHQATDSYNKMPQFRQEHCDQCGEKTIRQCPKCNADIRGHYYSPGAIRAYSAEVPSNCAQCGAAYPWTERNRQLAIAVADDTRDTLVALRQILVRFHLVVRQLRERHDTRPTLDVADEYDVQDLLHGLLRMFFDDVRSEEYTPSYAGKASRMDFLLKKESIVVETKMTRPGLGEKEVGTQLIEDIHRYSAHQDCKHLICFVYDPTGRISNPKGLERDLSKPIEKIEVEVIVVPRGY